MAQSLGVVETLLVPPGEEERVGHLQRDAADRRKDGSSCEMPSTDVAAEKVRLPTIGPLASDGDTDLSPWK